MRSRAVEFENAKQAKQALEKDGMEVGAAERDDAQMMGRTLGVKELQDKKVLDRQANRKEQKKMKRMEKKTMKKEKETKKQRFNKMNAQKGKKGGKKNKWTVC